MQGCIPDDVNRAALALVTVVALTSPQGAAAAQDSRQTTGPRLTELTLAQLGELEVTTVSKQPEVIWRTAVAVHVITAEDIRRSGATSIPEVLRLAPGVEVARIDADHWSIGVRGFGDQFSKSLLVLIDGRSIYTPLFAGMYWPAHDTMLEDVDRVEVIRGPGGTIWGANAVNGVINIITRGAADTHGTLVALGAGTVDRGAAAVRYGGRAGTVDYRAYAKGISRGPQFHTDGIDFDDWWTSQAGFRSDWSNAAGHSLTLQADVSHGRHGQRVLITTMTPAAQLPVDGYLEASGINLLARWEHLSANGAGVRLQGYYDHTSWLAPHFGESRHTFDLDFLHRISPARRHTFTWGAGTRHSPSLFTQVVPTLDFEPRARNEHLFSAFLQDEVELVRGRVWLTGGSKLERNQYTGVELEPSVRVVWTPTGSQSLWSAVTRAVRTPSRIERDIFSTSLSSTTNVIPVFLTVAGSPAFDAERLVGYETGYRALLGADVYVDAAVFHNVHDSLSSFGTPVVTLVGTPRPQYAVATFPYVNEVSGSSDGFEISPEWRPHARWQLKGSYSFVRFDLAITPASVDTNAVARYEGSSPHHQVRVDSSLTLPGRTELFTTYRYASALPARLVDAYHTADLRAAWRISTGLELSVSGQNLLQPHHVEFPHSAGPAVGISRSAFLGFVWSREAGRR